LVIRLSGPIAGNEFVGESWRSVSDRKSRKWKVTCLRRVGHSPESWIRTDIVLPLLLRDKWFRFTRKIPPFFATNRTKKTFVTAHSS